LEAGEDRGLDKVEKDDVYVGIRIYIGVKGRERVVCDDGAREGVCRDWDVRGVVAGDAGVASGTGVEVVRGDVPGRVGGAAKVDLAVGGEGLEELLGTVRVVGVLARGGVGVVEEGGGKVFLSKDFIVGFYWTKWYLRT